jgi:hypothetical protein
MNSKKVLTAIAAAFTLVLVTSTAQASLFSDFTDRGSFAPWFADSAFKMEHNQIMKGYPDGEFKGTDMVNRAELAVILDRYSAKVLGKELDMEPYACTAEYVYGLRLYIVDQNGATLEGVSISTNGFMDSGSFDEGGEGWYTGLGEGKGQYNLVLEKEGYVTHYDTVHLINEVCHVDEQMKTVMMVKKSA